MNIKKEYERWLANATADAVCDRFRKTDWSVDSPISRRIVGKAMFPRNKSRSRNRLVCLRIVAKER